MSEPPATLPPHVSTYQDRHGRTRYRFRRKGLPARSLPGEPGDERFEVTYRSAMRGERGPGRRHRAAPVGAARTMRAAWNAVRATIEWQQLKPSSKYQQTGVAERFLSSTIAPHD